MRITFLGTGSAAPTLARNVSGLALQLPQRGEVWLFDCGEGTQHRFLESDLKLSQVRRIFITHLHGDHVYGLLGLLATCGQFATPRAIDLYGPPGLLRFVRSGMRYSHLALPYPLAVHSVEAGLLLDDGEFAVRCLPLHHRVPTFGYRVDEHDRPGMFDVAAALALGIPPGPLYRRLKDGERLHLPDGRELDGSTLVGPPEPGRSLAYCTDTAYAQQAVDLARGVDLLVHEATFASRDLDLARESGHSTAEQAARVAREAGARRLALTHLSSRYAPGNPATAEDLLAEARAVFPDTVLAHDLLTLEIPRRRPRPARQPGRAAGSEARS